MIVVLYDTNSGAERSFGSSVPATTPNGMSVFTLDEPYEMMGRYTWDAEARELVARPAGTPVISRQTFMDRIGDDAVAAIVAAGKVSSDVAAWLLRYQIVQEINIEDPRTIAGVDALIAAGMIPANRRAAILARDGA